MKNCPRWHASVGVVVGSNVGKELGTRVGMEVVGSNVGKELGTRVGMGVVVGAEVLGAGEGLKT